MKLGLLWYDADQRVSPTGAPRRGRHPLRRALQAPGQLLPRQSGTELFADPTISVVANPTILKHHFWVGRDEALEPERRRRVRKDSTASAPPESPSTPLPESAISADEAPGVVAADPVALSEEPADDPSPVVLDAPVAAPMQRRRRSAARAAASEVAAAALDDGATDSASAPVAATEQEQEAVAATPTTAPRARKPRVKRVTGRGGAPAVPPAAQAASVSGKRAPRRAVTVEAAPPAAPRLARTPVQEPKERAARQPAPKRVSAQSRQPHRRPLRRSRPRAAAARSRHLRPRRQPPRRSSSRSAASEAPRALRAKPPQRRRRAADAQVVHRRRWRRNRSRRPPAGRGHPKRPAKAASPASAPVVAPAARTASEVGEVPRRRARPGGPIEARRQGRGGRQGARRGSAAEAGPRHPTLVEDRIAACDADRREARRTTSQPKCTVAQQAARNLRGRRLQARIDHARLSTAGVVGGRATSGSRTRADSVCLARASRKAHAPVVPARR